jgi:hypothetical protein
MADFNGLNAPGGAIERIATGAAASVAMRDGSPPRFDAAIAAARCGMGYRMRVTRRFENF